jgi:hypothetical protein
VGDEEGPSGTAAEAQSQRPLVTAPAQERTTEEPKNTYNLRTAAERRAPAWQKDYVMATVMFA